MMVNQACSVKPTNRQLPIQPDLLTVYEEDILTLPINSITGSTKLFFARRHVKELAYHIFAAGVMKPESSIPEAHSRTEIRLFRKKDHLLNQRVRANWDVLGCQPMMFVSLRLVDN